MQLHKHHVLLVAASSAVCIVFGSAIYSVTVAATTAPVATVGAQRSAAPALESTGTSQDLEASAIAFKEIAQVLRHPRCMNCHTVTEFPRQGDDRHRHQQFVMRGAANMGAPTMQCLACHQATNTHDGRVPGAPNWHLAPLSMGWEKLNTDRALCEALKDRTKNGDKDVAHLVEHMTSDPLVQWAWSPGRRLPPSLGQEEFHRLVAVWAQTGAACPSD